MESSSHFQSHTPDQAPVHISRSDPSLRDGQIPESAALPLASFPQPAPERFSSFMAGGIRPGQILSTNTVRLCQQTGNLAGGVCVACLSSELYCFNTSIPCFRHFLLQNQLTFSDSYGILSLG